MKVFAVLLFAILTIPLAAAQPQSPDTTPDSAKSTAAHNKDKAKKEPATANPDKSAESAKPAEPSKSEEVTDKDKEEHFDVAEVPPIVTHHQITLNGKMLNYTATTGT